MAVVSMSYLLEAGVHFGHQTKRWNPKMREYIYTARNDIYIIDLQKTARKIEEAYNALHNIASNGGKVLFVGTRKQASEAIREEALRSNSFYVNERWLGGTLTNFKTIRRRIKRLEEIERMEKNGIFEVLPKKEVIGIKKEYEKLNKVLCGIREMYKLPNALFVVDPSKEEIAIKEARKLNIPIFGIVDTNCDPDMVDYIIPGNDDAIRAVKLITAVMANAINSATGGKIIEFGHEDKNTDDNAVEIMQKALETVKKKEEKNKSFDGKYRYDRKDNNRRRPNNIDRFKNNKEKEEKIDKKEVENKVLVKEEKIDKKEVENKVLVKEEKPVEKSIEKVEKATEKKPDLSKLTVAELRQLAKEKNVKGYSTMKKTELLESLK